MDSDQQDFEDAEHERTILKVITKKQPFVWYKFTTFHGPGHQSTTERYTYSRGELTRSARKELIDNECDRFDSYYMPIVRLKRVSRIPLSVTQSMRRDARNQIGYLQEKIKALDEVETNGR